jgi:hypothetical protein
VAGAIGCWRLAVTLWPDGRDRVHCGSPQAGAISGRLMDPIGV